MFMDFTQKNKKITSHLAFLNISNIIRAYNPKRYFSQKIAAFEEGVAELILI